MGSWNFTTKIAIPTNLRLRILPRRRKSSPNASSRATHQPPFRDYKPYLAPGEVATIAVIASDRRQSRTIFRYTSGLLREIPSLAAMVEDDTSDQIKLNNRVIIEITTASFRLSRGYTFASVLADETAFGERMTGRRIRMWRSFARFVLGIGSIHTCCGTW
jgi:hypothetical protein